MDGPAELIRSEIGAHRLQLDMLVRYSKMQPLHPELCALLTEQSSEPLDQPALPPLGRSQHRLTPIEVDQLVTDYQAGTQQKELAKRYRVSRETVRGHLQRAGVWKPRGLTVEQVEAAVRRYAEGHSTAAIGQRLGFDDKTIATALKKRGVQLRAAWDRLPH